MPIQFGKAICLIGAILCLSAAISNSEDPLTQLVEKFDRFRKQYPQEKIHLHFDKPFYAIGDTIYFKAYVVNSLKNEPSQLNNLLHIEFIDVNNRLLRDLIMPLVDGISFGSLPIPNDIPPGNFRIRAYTNWMRNFDAEYFFDRSFPLGKAGNAATDKKIALSPGAGTEKNGSPANETTQPAIERQPDYGIGIYPEAGQLINGLPARLAFKALDKSGLGTSCKVRLLDGNGTALAMSSTGYAGMGHLDFTPMHGQTYTVSASFADGTEKRLAVMPAKASGYALSIRRTDSGDLRIRITANVPAGKAEYYLLAQSAGNIQYIAKNRVDEKGISATLSSRRFSTGVLQFTLFDGDLHPVAERLVFIDNHDQLRINLKPIKENFAPREKVQLDLLATDNKGEPVLGSFSVSVTNASKLATAEEQEKTILTDLLLTSDLRGYIESPNYYFSGTTEAMLALDDLMLTQGWRRFIWQDILAEKLQPVDYQPATSLTIAGKILNKNGTPVAGGKVSMISISGTSMTLDTITDSNGRFLFDRLSFIDSLQYQVQGKTATGDNNVTIIMDSFPGPAITINKNLPDCRRSSDTAFLSYLKYRGAEFDQMKKYGRFPKDATLLKAVEVRAKKMTLQEEAVLPSSNLNGPGRADQVLTYEDFQDCHDFSSCIQGKLRGIRLKSMLYPPGDRNATPILMAFSNSPADVPMLLIRDGAELPVSDLRNINPYDIQSVEVLRSGSYTHVYGTRGINGIILITSKRGGIDYNAKYKKALEAEANKGHLNQRATGYYTSRQFYAPDYSTSVANVDIPDERSTVYWAPNLVTDDDGKALLEFFHSDEKGKFKVQVEGLTESGKIGRKVFYYEVK